METIINTPPQNDSGGGSAGWAVAVIILIAVIAIGAYMWVRSHRTTPTPTNGASINVTLPSVPTSDTSGNESDAY